MNPKWISEEAQLWNAIMDPGSPALNRMARKVERMPSGKNKTRLHEQISKARSRQFAAGWTSLRSLIDH